MSLGRTRRSALLRDRAGSPAGKQAARSPFGVGDQVRHPAFGQGDFKWIDCKNDAVAAYTRTFENETIYVLNNLSAGEQAISVRLKTASKQLNDVLTDTNYFFQDHTLKLEMAPRQFLWLV